MKKGWKVLFEWDVEYCDKYGDIIEHYHADTLIELKNTDNEIDAQGLWNRLVLVRDVIKPTTYTQILGEGYGETVDERSWCYVTKDGILPETTDNGAKIPKKYLKEFEANKEWASKLGDRVDWEKNLNEFYSVKEHLKELPPLRRAELERDLIGKSDEESIKPLRDLLGGIFS